LWLLVVVQGWDRMVVEAVRVDTLHLLTLLQWHLLQVKPIPLLLVLVRLEVRVMV